MNELKPCSQYSQRVLGRKTARTGPEMELPLYLQSSDLANLMNNPLVLVGEGKETQQESSEDRRYLRVCLIYVL